MNRHLRTAALVLLAIYGMVPTACYDDGVVSAECAKGYTECDGLCVDLLVDGNNCGACGVICPGGRPCHDGEYCEGFGPGAGGQGGDADR